VVDGAVSQVWTEIYKNRSFTLTGGLVFKTICEKLPPALHPLANVLVGMRDCLVHAYRRFEEYFDGSEILSIATDFIDLLWNLSFVANSLSIGVPEAHLTLPDRKNVDEFSAVELPETD